MSTMVPSLRTIVPSTWSVLRRRARAGVDRCRWAFDKKNANTAAATAATSTPFVLCVVAGEDGESAPGQGEHQVGVQPAADQLEVVADSQHHADDDERGERRGRSG